MVKMTDFQRNSLLDLLETKSLATNVVCTSIMSKVGSSDCIENLLRVLLDNQITIMSTLGIILVQQEKSFDLEELGG